MVMHARKTQRANDGYFEKHQSHPYQNSKYSSSKSFSSSAERYERIRDSPNGNYRSDSPDSQSPRDRDRSYQSKSSYLQKIREKERENRDYKLSRDKYSDCRSPKEKRTRESEHRTNHDRSDDKGVSHSSIKSQSLSSRDRKPVHNNCVDKRDERERVPRVGDWSEHISSSGKKYYYNCKTEVSQWEKPREWIDRERERDRERDRDRERERDRDRDRERFRTRDRDRDFDRSYGSSSRSGTRHEKHSNSRGSNGNSASSVSGGGGATRHWGAGRDDNNGGGSGGGGGDNTSSRDARTTSRKYSDDAVQSTQDMDISPGDSTPTSEISYGHHQGVATANVVEQQQPGVSVATSSAPPLVGPVLLSAALPRLVSHPPVVVHHHHHLPTTPTSRPEASPLYNPQTTSSMIIPPAAAAPPQSVATSNAPGPPVVVSLPRIMSQQVVSVTAATASSVAASMVSSSPVDVGDAKGLQIVHNSAVAAVARQISSCSDASAQSHGLQPLTIDVNHGTGATSGGPIGEGPPTPTHSETLDCGKATVVTTSLASPPSSSLSSLQSVSSSLQALRPQGPTLTPSLANYYRDDLVNHVRGWPAEILEKQADKLAQEAFIMSSIQCAKVSAELKSARSIVRLTEIQATLQEQRILFLRQQIKTLEEMKSQNSFMSDDS